MFISSLRAARLYGAGAALFVASSSICRADLLVTTSTTLDTPITGNVIIASTDPYNYATAINVNIVNGANISGGVTTAGLSATTMMGGTINSGVNVTFLSHFYLYGGAVNGNLSTQDEAGLDIYGGSFSGNLDANVAGTIALHGYGLTETLLSDTGLVKTYRLNGNLSDGSPLDTIATVTNNGGRPFRSGSLTLLNSTAAVPEPNAIGLYAGVFAVGAALRRRR